LTLRDWSRSGAEVGPEILASGPPITVIGGHCWFLGGEADGPDGIRQAVHDRVSRGVEVIKIMVTGANMTPTLGPHESQYTAHAAGLPIAAHAHGGQGIADAMSASVDSIEHCTFFTADGVKPTLRSSPSSAVVGRWCQSPAAHFPERHLSRRLPSGARRS
jgi:imidazolonepropionase-like amidohydrolase